MATDFVNDALLVARYHTYICLQTVYGCLPDIAELSHLNKTNIGHGKPKSLCQLALCTKKLDDLSVLESKMLLTELLEFPSLLPPKASRSLLNQRTLE